METAKVIALRKPLVLVTRGYGIESGELQVVVDGKKLVTLHYDYCYMDNATQWSLAEQIARTMFPNVDIVVNDGRR